MEQWLYRVNDEIQKQLKNDGKDNACLEVELARKTEFLS